MTLPKGRKQNGPDRMKGLFITFEGNEGSGKSTQIAALAARLESLGRKVRALREPGGTAVGEEIRHTLKHSPANAAMTPEAELLLMSASRAQLVRETIRPALETGLIVLCDRFYDSTLAYQGYGRKLDLHFIEVLTEFAVGTTRPDLTLLLLVPERLSVERRAQRQAGRPVQRDRIEESDSSFFARVSKGYGAIARAEPNRVRSVDATASPHQVEAEIWKLVQDRLSI
jgi:dTMP kinase